MSLLRTLIAAFCFMLLCEAAVSQTPAVWNILDHGAKNGEDATAVIQLGLSTQHQHGLPVFIPAGRFLISDTLRVPFKVGGALWGVAAGMPIMPGHPFEGAMSRLVWVGPTELPMIYVPGSEFHFAGGLALIGRLEKSDQPRCAVGILLSKPDRGIGTGKLVADNVRLANFQTAIQCGLLPGEHNNDFLSWRRLTIEDCDVGYQLINSQSMGHSVENLLVRGTPVTFDVYGGGMLMLRNALCFDTTLLRLSQNDPKKYSPGVNNATFVLDQIKVDASSGNKFKLVEMRDALPAQIVSNVGHLSPGNYAQQGGVLAELRGAASLTLRDWYKLQRGSFLLHPDGRKPGNRPNVAIERSRLFSGSDELLHPSSINPRAITLRDCYRPSGEPIVPAK